MYEVSQAYKEQMKIPIRNRSYMRVILGLINLEAQNTAVMGDDTQYTSYSDPASVFNKNDIGNIYATYEQDFFKTDGSMYFLPRDENNQKKNGIITESLFSENVVIQFSFDLSTVRGLTIQFDENYPTLFSITTSDGTEVEFENGASRFETDMVFENTTSFTIKLKSLRKPNNRVRIFYIKFGQALEYDNEWIVNTTSSSALSNINESLPKASFSVTLKNEDQRFNVDNPSSEINFLEPGQNLSVVYGYELDDGSIEWMQLHTLYVSEWSANDSQANISAVDRLQRMDGNYYKGRYYDNGISLYDLAELVLSDAELTQEEYFLDDYLKEITVYNPLPNVTHKEALQIIANAGRCILDYDRYGKIRIHSSFSPDVTISSNGEEYFSSLPDVLNNTAKNHYATYAQNYWQANDTFLFLPKSGGQNTGYISEQISDSNGLFSENPLLTLVLENEYPAYGINILFSGNLPKKFIIRTYVGEMLQKTLTVEENITHQFELLYDFGSFEKMEIEFTETQVPNNRIQIDYLSLGDETDYIVEYDDLYSTPTGTQIDKVKNLNVGRSIYSEGTQDEDLSSDTIVYEGNNLIYYFSEACHEYSVEVEGEEGQILLASSGAYYAELVFYGFSVGQQIKFTIKGKKYNISTNYYTLAINNRGTDMTWSNPLISDYQHCKDVAEWVGDYESSEVEYELDFRGEPALDCGDTIFQENKYVEHLKVVIEEHQMTFNGAVKGALRTRRKDRVARAENQLGEYRLL